MLCSKGAKPCKLKTNTDGVKFNGKNYCSVADVNPIENHYNFGICSVTQKPCTNCIKLLAWEDFKKDVRINGNLALLDKSHIKCATGGEITFMKTGQ